MLPKLILNDNSEISIKEVISAIKDYEFCIPAEEDSYFDVCRIGGVQYTEKEDYGTDILAWQCNMANISNADVKLPTIITIHLDTSGIIKQIELNSYFKGSQGIPCSRKYLNRKLKELYLNLPLSMDETLFFDQFKTCCRHTYELMMASCSLREWCMKNNKKKAFLSEATAAYKKGNKIVALDRISLNKKEVISKIEVENYKGNIFFDQSGAIVGCNHLLVRTYLKDNQHFLCNEGESTKEIRTNSRNEFSAKLMKRISKCWLTVGYALGVKNRFYFSQIWPPTFLGIITQMIGIAMFDNSYSYFQHVISGLQTNERRYLCIGVAENISKAMEVFNDICLDDYYD